VKGVDIDSNLIKSAKRNIVHYIDENYVSQMEKSFNNIDHDDTADESLDSNVLKENDLLKKDVVGEKGNVEESTLLVCEEEKEAVEANKDKTLQENLTNQEEEKADEKHKEEKVDEKYKEELKNQPAIANQKNLEIVEKKKESEEKEGLLERLEKNCHAKEGNAFPYNVSFILENYVPGGSGVMKYIVEEYHTILCLSVTKWIQLNFGDSGIKLMFQKVYKQLHAGGRFILEPQPHKSYKRRKNLTPAIRRNYDAMKLMPEQYIEYLMSDKVGFSKCEQIDITLHEKQGFQRPIYVLTK